MLRRSHIIVSELALTSGCLLTRQSIPVTLISSLGVWLGAQLPDVDQSQNRLDRHFPPLKFIAHHARHRTWTHCWLAVLVMLVIALLLPVPSKIPLVNVSIPVSIHPFVSSPHLANPFDVAYFAVVIGFFLHIFEDSFSHQGICWFYPFTNFHHYRGQLYKPSHQHWWFYRTGGTGEKIIRQISLILWAIAFILIVIANVIGYGIIFSWL